MMNLKKFIINLLIITFAFSSIAEEKIISAPLINLNELKPSFEETDNSINTQISAILADLGRDFDVVTSGQSFTIRFNKDGLQNLANQTVGKPANAPTSNLLNQSSTGLQIT